MQESIKKNYMLPKFKYDIFCSAISVSKVFYEVTEFLNFHNLLFVAVQIFKLTLLQKLKFKFRSKIFVFGCFALWYFGVEPFH